jgi:2-C-methyl-D-erythritol 4-phosphate cytidylyltransferase
MSPGQVWVIVVAAGRGVRFGSVKQFERLGDSSVVELSIATARRHADGVVAVVPVDGPAVLPGADVVVAGGPTRSSSVRNGLAAIPKAASAILVHDAARPLAGDAIYEAVRAALGSGADAVVPVVPVADTLRTVDGGPADRDRFVAVQTPQGFSRSALTEALGRDNEATDEATLVEQAGYVVELVDGEHRNFKVTGPDDLRVAEVLIADGALAPGDPS